VSGNDQAVDSFNLSQPMSVFQAPMAMADPMANMHGNSTGFNFSPEYAQAWDESSLAYFLNDIMVPTTPMHDMLQPSNQSYQPYYPRDYLDFGTFNPDPMETDVMLDSDFSKTMPMNSKPVVDSAPGSGTKTPVLSGAAASGNAAFMRSVWIYTPTHMNRGGEDTINLSLPQSVDSPETRTADSNSIYNHCVDNQLRDQILAYVLNSSDASFSAVIASSFPSTELLNKLLHFYMTVHLAQTDAWLHLPTLILDDQSIDLTTMMISAGAVICSVPSLRRLGYALQETVRTGTSRKVSPFSTINVGG
jgi:hypothetical protein